MLNVKGNMIQFQIDDYQMWYIALMWVVVACGFGAGLGKFIQFKQGKYESKD